MPRTNGKSEVAPQQFDTEHELPASEDQRDDASGSSTGPRIVSDTQAEPREAEILRLKAERDSLVDRLARLQAEFENARRRASREQQDFREFAAADTIRTLLPVLDSFERALKAAPSEKSEFRSGIDLIQKQFEDVLSKLGLHPIPATGEPFNPHLHEAVEMVDTTHAEDHTILDEFQRGYKLKDRLLRPAMVKVARNPNK
jgi:molecular chaperone GrpE